MPTTGESPEKALSDVVDAVGRYPLDAYLFVQAALHHTAEHVHGARPADDLRPDRHDADATRHVTGRQLCEGIRDFALARWGRMARGVLGRWGVTGTIDFGRIVFALVDAGLMSKTDDDRLEDFADVFDFRADLEGDYRLPPRWVEPDAAVGGGGKPCPT